jgi:hypothetical protein
MLEIRPAQAGTRTLALALAPMGRDGRLYRKRFLQLEGMGVRDICSYGDDLPILTGPTMDITGLQGIYRLRYASDLADDSITALDGTRLMRLFDLPAVIEVDKAEGLCRYEGPGEPDLLIVYDTPRSNRLVADDSVLADVFALPGY